MTCATLHLIVGFLGSGKTTLLSNLLEEMSASHRIAVIQNEFAPTGIDGKILKQTGHDFQLVEINNGSVFCVCQLGNFDRKLERLLDEYRPDLVFLEASGLSDPISIVDIMSSTKLRDRITFGQVVCLIDAPNFERGMSGLQRFRHQIMVADNVIINKMDRFDGDLAKIQASIRQLNPWATIRTAQYADVAWSKLSDNEYRQTKAAGEHSGKISAGRPEMSACVLRTHETINESGLKKFLHDLQPVCPRIKGYLNLQDGRVMSVSSVLDDLEIREIGNYTGPSELIVFGDRLTASSLRKSFRTFSQAL
jgi:G3E family GTPase